MEEIWKPLVYDDIDLSDRFEISNIGNMRNINTKKLLKQQTNDRGYKEICITLGSRKKYKCLRIHRCVAFMFVDGYEKGLIVNHIDGNKTNNVYTNLEWVTLQRNAQHAVEHGLSKNNKPIMCIETQDVFSSIKEASEWCGLHPSGKSIGEYINHPEFRKSAGRHPVTKEKLTWMLI